jgi:hypothetical protein
MAVNKFNRGDIVFNLESKVKYHISYYNKDTKCYIMKAQLSVSKYTDKYTNYYYLDVDSACVLYTKAVELLYDNKV